MNPEIEHTGVIFDIIGNRIDVSVEAKSACGSCKVKNICGMSESEEKLISVMTPTPEAFEVGEQVIVSVTKGMGIKAVILAYVVPLVLILATLLILTSLSAGEITAGLSAVAVGGLYYTGLYLLRNRIEQEIIFKIRKI